MDRFRTLAGLRTEAERIRRNIVAILSTCPGRRLIRRDFGCELGSLLLAPAGTDTTDEMRRRIAVALANFERRIALDDVRIQSPDPGSRTMMIEIDYRQLSTGDRHSLFFPLETLG